MIHHRRSTLRSLSGTAAAALLLALTTAACAAKYQTLHRDPASGATAAGGTGTSTGAVAPPTAGIQVLVGGQPVTQVQPGQPFTISPTSDTQAPGGPSDQSCPHPGIVAAHYRVSDGHVLDATRAHDCSALTVPDTIATPGTYQVTLQVTSDTNVTAQASMTLLVASGAGGGVPGFGCTATPQETGPTQPITFTGTCAGGTTAWDFGDGATGQGSPAVHAYASPGQFFVAATCTLPTGTATASVTVTIVSQGSVPGGVTPTSQVPPPGGVVPEPSAPPSGGPTGTGTSPAGGTVGGGDAGKGTPGGPNQTPTQTPSQAPLTKGKG